MRQRVTVSLPSHLLEEAERVGRQLGARTRSGVVERALTLLIHAARQEEIDASLNAYYGTLAEDERAEESAMVNAFNRSRQRRDLDQE